MPVELTLFTREGCHLCDQALSEISRDLPWIVVREIDVDSALELFEQYDLRVPVLKLPCGLEFDWPFTAAAIRPHLR